MNNLHKYKKALLHVKDLTKAIEILGDAMSKLNPYAKYDSVYNTIAAMDATKTLLEIHLHNQKRIVDNQGLEG